jgi:hypothetical protein
MRARGPCLLALLASSAVASAADPPAPRPAGPAPDILEPPPEEFYTPRNLEALLQLATRSDWYDGPHVSVGLISNFSRPWDDQMRVRTGGYFAIMAGSWGDGDRGHVSPEPGIVHRASFYMDELFDLHALGRVGVPIGLIEDKFNDEAQFGVRGSAGLGFRVARMALIELSYDRVWVFGEPFADQDGTNASRHTGGLTLAAGIDLCFLGCASERPEPRPIDLTERLYDKAEDVCRTPEQECRLCNAVDEAMDANRYYPRHGQDGIEGFLLGLSSLLDGALQERVKQLLVMHRDFRERRDRSKAWSRWAAQTKRDLARPLSYAPVAVELRRALGCDRYCPAGARPGE